MSFNKQAVLANAEIKQCNFFTSYLPHVRIVLVQVKYKVLQVTSIRSQSN